VTYTVGTEYNYVCNGKGSLIDQEKKIFQLKKCKACHQLYGLAGYLGPELKTAWSDKSRGEEYIKFFLRNGSSRMPVFHFSESEISALVSYLHSTAVTYKN
jgi:nitric oxide reductase subunit C